MNDKNKDTFWVAAFVTDLETGASTRIFGSERCNPYPVKCWFNTLIFLKETVKNESPTTLHNTTKYLDN